MPRRRRLYYSTTRLRSLLLHPATPPTPPPHQGGGCEGGAQEGAGGEREGARRSQGRGGGRSALCRLEVAPNICDDVENGATSTLERLPAGVGGARVRSVAAGALAELAGRLVRKP